MMFNDKGGNILEIPMLLKLFITFSSLYLSIYQSGMQQLSSSQFFWAVVLQICIQLIY